MENIAIIILNWNNAATTLNCINSLRGILNIIIIDNGSEEKDFKRLQENLPKDIHLISNSSNLGFSEGNNIGIKYAIEHLKADYIILLNNDTIVNQNFIEPLIKTIESDNSIAAVQPKILKIKNKSTIDSAGQIAYKYGSVRDRGINQPDCPVFQRKEEIFGACGAAVLYRASALKEIGFFDKQLFCLFEDVDIAWRLRLKGYKIIYSPESIVYHERGISGVISKTNKTIRRFFGFRNCLIITLRYYPKRFIFLFLPVHIYRFLTAWYFKLKYKIHLPFIELLSTAIQERHFIQKSNLIKEIQAKWII
jgi:GT2 family glycosyltransferase